MLTGKNRYGWRHAKRPGLDEFLKEIFPGRYHELVIYSNGSLNFTADIVDQIAAMHGHFTWRLGGDDMVNVKGANIKAKDISGLNRYPLF